LSLKELPIRDEYRSDYTNLIRDFYVPCLEQASVYNRAVGFFSSSSMAAVAQGLTAFIRSQGHMRLVTSPKLSPDDIEAIDRGLQEREQVIERALLREFDQELEQVVKDRLACLAWLLSKEVLDIKLAIPTNVRQWGIYHEKLGVFQDRDDNYVTFTGSANESSSALIDNFECLDVYTSWDERVKDRASRKFENFQRLWDDETPNVDILSFPEAAAKSLLKYRPDNPPDWEPGLPKTPFTGEPNDGKYNSGGTSGTKNFLKVELRPRQVDALDAWCKAGYRGILAMATGTGKTITALGAITKLKDLELVVISAPTNEIVQQWVEELANRTSFHAPILAAGRSEDWREPLFRKLRLLKHKRLPREKIPLIVVGSYGELSKVPVLQLIEDAGGLPEQSLLIGDEVHTAGATTYQHLLQDGFQYRLGLSATPLRQYDEEGTEVMLDYFGGIVYEFLLDQAIAVGILCEYDYHVFIAELTDDEYDEFKELTTRLGQLMNSDDPDDQEQAKRVAIQRANILKSASSKLAALEDIVSRYPPQRSMVYCADIDQATEASRSLTHQGFRAVRYSSEDPNRKALLAEFASGRLDALVAIKCLDEGVDVPETDLAIILASDTSERQFVQRRGRVLRASAGKDFATVVDVLVVPPTTESAESVLKNEVRRFVKFAQSARNRMVAVNRLVHQLEPYGISHSDVF
jgi:superfamily II DNA or RNA helicase